jgi:hypothetical protein
MVRGGEVALESVKILTLIALESVKGYGWTL